VGRIRAIFCKGIKRKRFLDFGFIKGAMVAVVRRSPSGSPTAYYINGTTIAIRDEDAKTIFVNPEI
jgi:ferrous iron transport protein A